MKHHQLTLSTMSTSSNICVKGEVDAVHGATWINLQAASFVPRPVAVIDSKSLNPDTVMKTTVAMLQKGTSLRQEPKTDNRQSSSFRI
jgi:hypothetical protein